MARRKQPSEFAESANRRCHQRIVRRPSPRRRVTNHLLDLGYKLNDDDIHVVHGGAHKRLSDIIECWHVECWDANDNRVSIYSGHTLTSLAAGLTVEKNTPETCLYGDFVAVPKRRTPNDELSDGPSKTK